MEIKEAAKIRDYIVKGEWVMAANFTLSLMGKDPIVETKDDALVVLRGLLQHLLDSELYLHAGTLLWGPEMFCAEPKFVQDVFRILHSEAKILIQGAASTGKSYNAGVWMYLDWRRDPEYTSIKCIGTSEDQVRKHVFAHLVKLHRAACIPMEEEVIIRDSDMWLGVKGAGFEFGITSIAYKQSQETSGAVKGYKSMPVRTHPHPKFGLFSRLRLLADEAQNIPGGPFQDLNSWVSQIDGTEFVKIALAYNPEDVTRTVVTMAEPEQGWGIEDLDKLYEWKSKAGWNVLRLDAAKSENVIAKRKIYHGIQSYEGFMGYILAGGDTSASYMCFGRGFPPTKGVSNTIIPMSWPQEARGEAIFIGVPENVAAVDLAFMGMDSAQMAVGRWGLASGYRVEAPNTLEGYKVVNFTSRLNISKKEPRHVLQLDQVIPMEKHDDTVMMAEEIMGRCNMLGIKPEWVGVDCTGIGLGTHSHLNKVWGDVMGIAWNTMASEKKILAEDKQNARETCDGVMSEMWYAFRRWLDPRVKAVLINPIIPQTPLNSQLTTRRYSTGKNGIKVESKEQYKARNQRSPDEADCAIMLCHVVRMRAEVTPGLVEETKPSHNTVQRDEGTGFTPVTKRESVDAEDSICKDGVDG